MGIDLVLASLAVYAAIVCARRPIPRLEMALGLVFLVDNVVYVATLIPVAAVSIGVAAIFVAAQAPLIFISVRIIARSRAALRPTHDHPDTAAPRADALPDGG